MHTRWHSGRGRLVATVALFQATSAFAQTPTLVNDSNRALTFSVFAALFALTLVITYFAARRNHTVKDFYTAGGSIDPKMNGLAIAGDYLSAAAFLGVSGLIALYGLDGITYLAGFFISFIPVLLLVAEPCRNLGRYTLGDVLAFRNSFRSTKTVVAISSILVALFYMVPQIVGGAVIIRALIGIEYEVSVVAVGALMLGYVMFGGMRATTSVQILKAVLLISFCFLLVVLAWAPYGLRIGSFFDDVAAHPAIQRHVLDVLLQGKSSLTAPDAGQRFLESGLYLKNPVEQLSLGLALVFGTAAMPHILMRFFTVQNAKSARTSALYGMLAIGLCHLLIVVIGFAAALYVGPEAILGLDKGGNLAAPMLAQYLGGGPESVTGNFMLAFVAAVAFATIVAVVAGLTLACASALAHDVYVGAIRGGHATEREQTNAARIATLAIALIAILAGMAAKGQNVAHLVGLGYAVAASANLPALLMTLYWRRCSTAGVIAGVVGGTVLAIGMVLVSPNMTYPAQQRATALSRAASLDDKIRTERSEGERGVEQLAQWRKEADAARAIAAGIPANATSMVGLREPLISLRNPGLISIPVGFLLVIVFSIFFPSHHSLSLWKELAVRRETGLGVAKAIAH